MDTNLMMNDTTDNNAEAAEVLDAETLGNITDLISEDEQAVVEASSHEEKKLTVVETIAPSSGVMLEIPEEERGTIDEEFSVELKEANMCGCFDATLGMKGFVTNTGRTIFAKICMDPSGNRFIEYCQKYSNGTNSAKMRIKQSDLIIAATCGFNSRNEENAKLRNQIDRFIMEATKDYLNKILFPFESMRMKDILYLLTSEYNNIPVESETGMSKLEQPDKLYPAVIGIIKKLHLNIMDEHSAYYTLWAEHIDELAKELGVKKLQLLKKLKEYHFLYLTESSEGYQTCVRFKGGKEFFEKSYTEWCYCILKLDYLAKKKMQKSEEAK